MGHNWKIGTKIDFCVYFSILTHTQKFSNCLFLCLFFNFDPHTKNKIFKFADITDTILVTIIFGNYDMTPTCSLFYSNRCGWGVFNNITRRVHCSERWSTCWHWIIIINKSRCKSNIALQGAISNRWPLLLSPWFQQQWWVQTKKLPARSHVLKGRVQHLAHSSTVHWKSNLFIVLLPLHSS